MDAIKKVKYDAENKTGSFVPQGLANSTASYNANNSKADIVTFDIDNINIETASGKKENYYSKHTHFGSSVIENPDGSWTEALVEKRNGKDVDVFYTHLKDGELIVQYNDSKYSLDRKSKTVTELFDADGKFQSRFIGKVYFEENGNRVMEGDDFKEVINTDGDTVYSVRYRFDGTVQSKYEVLDDGTIFQLYYGSGVIHGVTKDLRYEKHCDGDTVLDENVYDGDRIVYKFETSDDGTKTTRKFNEKSNLSYESIEKDGVINAKRFDKNSNLIYESSESGGMKTEKEYSGDNNLKVTVSHPSGQKDTSVYENGDLTFSSVVYPEGNEIKSVTTSYSDDTFSKRTITVYNEGSNLQMTEERYYNNGDSSILSVYSDGSSNNQTYRNGVLAAESVHNSSGTKVTNYDSNGNVTRVDYRN